MLKKRTRTVSSNQAFMADSFSLSSPTGKQIRPISSFFSSPKFFTVFSAKGSSETESIMSPTSILDTKPFSGFGNPFWSDKNTCTRLSPEPCLENKHHPWEKKLDSGGVGLGIVDALNEETYQKSSKPDSRMVLFGSQLKIQIPPLPPSVLSPTESPKSPTDFGIQTGNSQFGSANFGLETLGSPQVFTGCLSASDMELSEDYTCVIAHGPNPRTTHIFSDCIVENCCGIVGFSASKKENVFSVHSPSYPSQNFLSFCYNCKKNLGQGKDIFMYRGEKAFCSRECRYQEMIFDEGMDKSELEDPIRPRS